MPVPLQRCPRCASLMGAVGGSKDAVCRRCGYKDDCCVRDADDPQDA